LLIETTLIVARFDECFDIERLFQNSLSEVFSTAKRGRTLYNGINIGNQR